MKYETTFEELGKIFSTIAKAEEKVKALKEAEDQYNNASDAYYNGGDFEPMHEAFEARAKARKAVKKVFSELLCLLDIDGCCTSGEEGYIVELSKRLYEPLSFLTAIKEQAVRLAKSVTTY